MTPKEYMMAKKDIGLSKDVVGDVLTPRERLEAQDLLDAAYDYMGNKLSQNYDEMNPEAQRMASVLEGFLMVFIEHATNFERLRGVEAQM